MSNVTPAPRQAAEPTFALQIQADHSAILFNSAGVGLKLPALPPDVHHRFLMRPDSFDLSQAQSLIFRCLQNRDWNSFSFIAKPVTANSVSCNEGIEICTTLTQIALNQSDFLSGGGLVSIRHFIRKTASKEVLQDNDLELAIYRPSGGVMCVALRYNLEGRSVGLLCEANDSSNKNLLERAYSRIQDTFYGVNERNSNMPGAHRLEPYFQELRSGVFKVTALGEDLRYTPLDQLVAESVQYRSSSLVPGTVSSRPGSVVVTVRDFSQNTFGELVIPSASGKQGLVASLRDKLIRFLVNDHMAHGRQYDAGERAINLLRDLANPKVVKCDFPQLNIGPVSLLQEWQAAASRRDFEFFEGSSAWLRGPDRVSMFVRGQRCISIALGDTDNHLVIRSDQKGQGCLHLFISGLHIKLDNYSFNDRSDDAGIASSNKALALQYFADGDIRKGLKTLRMPSREVEVLCNAIERVQHYGLLKPNSSVKAVDLCMLSAERALLDVVDPLGFKARIVLNDGRFVAEGNVTFLGASVTSLKELIGKITFPNIATHVKEAFKFSEVRDPHLTLDTFLEKLQGDQPMLELEKMAKLSSLRTPFLWRYFWES